MADEMDPTPAESTDPEAASVSPEPEPAAIETTAEAPAEPETAAIETTAEAPAEPEPAATEAPAEPATEPEPAAGAQPDAAEPEPEPAAETTAEPATEAPTAAASKEEQADEEDFEPERPREKPAVPGADLEVDIVPEGVDPLLRGHEDYDPYAPVEAEPVAEEPVEEEVAITEPIAAVAIDLAAGVRYRATGKRKTAIARVILRPGSGRYEINGRELDTYFPREALQKNIRQPLEAVGYEARMDVFARLQGGGTSAQAGALRHGISRALLEADPNLRAELKRRGFLTRDARAKERKKAGLKKARKRPQFSKR